MTRSDNLRTPLLSMLTTAALVLSSAAGVAAPTTAAAQVPTVPPAASVRGLPDFTDLVDLVGPSVVNIRTLERASKEGPGGSTPDEQMLEFFRRFGIPIPPGMTPRAPRQERPPSEEAQPRGVGSGFILSADGLIMTNAHVVDGADELIVTLPDKREFKAKLVGADKRTDVAVVKIEASGLTAVKIGDINRLRVGEWVMAIGSPFGLENTVTAGIVSAKQRDTGDFLPFIQTDVAINPGNSGGPLFNMDGEVVGINSQIYSRTGGFMGLSFAVPIDVAMDVVSQLKASGKVTRGWLGVLIQDVTRELAESFGMPQPRGALVARVMPEGPAAKAGIEAGDIILRFNGEDIVYSSDLPPRVGRTAVGRKVAVEILRAGKPRTLQLAVEALPAEARAGAEKPAPAKISSDRLGLLVADLTDQQRERAGVERGGVLVRRVDAGAAQEAGVQRGDVILSVNNQTVDAAAGFKRLVERLPAGKVARLLVQRGQNPLWLALRVPK